MSWSAKQYLEFENERTRPVRDLLAAVPTVPVRRALDLGCGPGNSTEVLAARFPGAEISGLDSSEDMIAAACNRMPDHRFSVADLVQWDDPGPYDVLLSNAVLQWVKGHETLLPALVAKLADDGSLAVQMPDNLSEPAHVLMREVSASGPWAAQQKTAEGARVGRIGTPDWYYRLLQPHCRRVDIWRTTYMHVLAGADAVVEWFKGSGLRPYLAPLDPAGQAAYLDAYRARIAEAYPAQPDGRVLLPFPRLFIVATR